MLTRCPQGAFCPPLGTDSSVLALFSGQLTPQVVLTAQAYVLQDQHRQVLSHLLSRHPGLDLSVWTSVVSQLLRLRMGVLKKCHWPDSLWEDTLCVPWVWGVRGGEGSAKDSRDATAGRGRGSRASASCSRGRPFSREA